MTTVIKTIDDINAAFVYVAWQITENLLTVAK